jgi:hypothetical protein
MTENTNQLTPETFVFPEVATIDTPPHPGLIAIANKAGVMTAKTHYGVEIPFDGGGGGGADTDAIHDNVADEFDAVAQKSTPVISDRILIEDSADGFNKKYVEVGDLPATAPNFYGAHGIAFVDPTIGITWTNLNHGAGTYDKVNNQRLAITETGTGANQLRGWYTTAPATPYTVTAFIKGFFVSGNQGMGLFFRENATGEISAIYYGGGSVAVTNWTNASTPGSNLALVTGPTIPEWFRIVDDGTNRLYYVSADGVTWRLIHSVARTTFLTADQIGFHITIQTAVQLTASMLSWEVT